MSMKPESIEKEQASRLYIIFNKIQKGHVKSHWAHQDLKRTFHLSPKSHHKALLAVGRWSASVPLGYMRAGAILPAAGGKNKNRHHITSCTNDVGTFSTQSILLHFTPPRPLQRDLPSSSSLASLAWGGSKNTGHSDVLRKVPYGSLQSTNGLEWWFSVCLEPLKIFEKQFITAGRP